MFPVIVSIFSMDLHDPFRHIIQALKWRHNESHGVSNHQPHDCLLNRLFRRRSNKTSILRVTGLCGGNSPVTGEFPAQKASDGKMFPFDDVIMGYFTNYDCSSTSEAILKKRGNVTKRKPCIFPVYTNSNVNKHQVVIFVHCLLCVLKTKQYDYSIKSMA